MYIPAHIKVSLKRKSPTQSCWSVTRKRNALKILYCCKEEVLKIRRQLLKQHTHTKRNKRNKQQHYFLKIGTAQRTTMKTAKKPEYFALPFFFFEKKKL